MKAKWKLITHFLSMCELFVVIDTPTRWDYGITFSIITQILSDNHTNSINGIQQFTLVVLLSLYHGS